MMIGGIHAGKIVPDGCGHFHPGGKIHRRGRTDEKGEMDWQDGHGRQIKLVPLLGKDCKNQCRMRT